MEEGKWPPPNREHLSCSFINEMHNISSTSHVLHQLSELCLHSATEGGGGVPSWSAHSTERDSCPAEIGRGGLHGK